MAAFAAVTTVTAMTWLAGRAEVEPDVSVALQGQDAVIELVDVKP
jgi:hypothetical protein